MVLPGKFFCFFLLPLLVRFKKVSFNVAFNAYLSNIVMTSTGNASRNK